MHYSQNYSRQGFAPFFLAAFFLCISAHAKDRTFFESNERPSVALILEVLKHAPPVELSHQTDLVAEKEPHDGKLLHYNYPLWFNILIKRAPHMIASFEKGFPGATWVFIGRDTDLLADLFEAFYVSLGQNSRVKRVPMSRTTLEDWNPYYVTKYLQQTTDLPTDLKLLQNPYIFVDTISGGGGTQGRALINLIYQRARSSAATFENVLRKIHFLGLMVETSAIPVRDITEASTSVARLSAEKIYTAPDKSNIFSNIPIFTYTDEKQELKYQSVNEAGYAHWIGMWHGPYGKLSIDYDGSIFAPKLMVPEKLQKSLLEMRKALFNFQAHIINAAQKLEFFEAVQLEAKLLGYDYPRERLIFCNDPVKTLDFEIAQAKNKEELIAALRRYRHYNLNRSFDPLFSDRLADDLNRDVYSIAFILLPESTRLRLLQHPEFIESYMHLPIQTDEINMNIRLVGNNTKTHYRLVMRALQILKDRNEYKKILPLSFWKKDRAYRLAARKFKDGLKI